MLGWRRGELGILHLRDVPQERIAESYGGRTVGASVPNIVEGTLEAFIDFPQELISERFFLSCEFLKRFCEKTVDIPVL